jgi:hypothetical protein
MSRADDEVGTPTRLLPVKEEKADAEATTPARVTRVNFIFIWCRIWLEKYRDDWEGK